MLFFVHYCLLLFFIIVFIYYICCFFFFIFFSIICTKAYYKTYALEKIRDLFASYLVLVNNKKYK